MTTFLYRGIFLILDALLFAFLVKGFSRKQRMRSYDGWIFFVIILISFIESNFIHRQSTISWYNMISLIIVLIFVGNKYYLHRNSLVINILIFMSISMVSEGISLVFLEKIIGLDYQDILSTYLLLGTIITYLLKALFVYLFIKWLHYKKVTGEIIPRELIIPLVAMPIFSIVFLGVVLLMDVKNDSMFSWGRNVLILGTIIITFGLVYMIDRLSSLYKTYTEMKISNQLFETELKSVQSISDNLREIQILKHDMKNKLIVIEAYLNEEEYEQSRVYISDLINQIDYTKLCFYTPNYLLNYYLNKKIQYAESLGITCITNIFVPAETRIDVDVLSTLLGNLIDNAINACVRTENTSENKEIRLLIKEKPDKILFEIVNTVASQERRLDKKIFGTGLGLLSSKKIIEEHDGIYKQWYEDNRYYVSVIFFQ